ncbi:MAG: glycine--tRNA ligase subunit beta [Bryobacteraceae bacterium]|nr:glycine--tRNA ligase subunit beta [Bryobacteraceae bacterium]
MAGKPFLLEIGTEEIPDWMIRPALDNLRELFLKLLEENKLAGEVTSVDGTPRRLILRAAGLPASQKTVVELVTGPPVAAGENASAGFARKHGVEPKDLHTVSTPKGEYFAYNRQVPGRETADILSEALPELILKIYFPKTMYWTGKSGPRFIRPVRWIVALLANKVAPFELAGVASGKVSSGHRRLGRKKVPVSIRNYEEQLEKNFVLAAASARRRRIADGIEALLADRDLRVNADDALLDTLTYLTEYPTPILGNFDAGYLDLPEEVLVTVMRHHQRYFSVAGPDGKLAPHFVAVMNTAADPEGLVQAGNERVLRARFNDARFFWQFDQHRKLADRAADLAHVTYQQELGSYLDKANRMVEIVRSLGGSEEAQRAALIAKCDLTTGMVGEFPELQGVIGGLYARAQGEPEAVARAVYEHYKPLSMEDAIPATAEGRLVALADKLDALRECFRIGLVPTGSKDPFALRRAAQGAVKILVEGRLAFSVSELAAGKAALREFLLDRARYYFREIRGFAYDEINAALASGADDLTDLERRLEAVKAVRPTENFEPIAASFKRIKNILRQAEFTGGGDVVAELLEDGREAQLHNAFLRVRGEVESRRGDRDYQAALAAIASMRPEVDAFFDHVLVNAPDERVRRNRLTLLDRLLREFSSIADFSEIVTSKS